MLINFACKLRIRFATLFEKRLYYMMSLGVVSWLLVSDFPYFWVEAYVVIPLCHLDSCLRIYRSPVSLYIWYSGLKGRRHADYIVLILC